MENKKSIVVAITGASGSIYAKLLIEKLIHLNEYVDTEKLSLIVSDMGKLVFQHEMGYDVSELTGIKKYGITDFNAPFASGSAEYDSMIIIPCSMGTLGRIAHGVSENLITRTADVMLKEKKKLILVIRESPYNLIHIKNMELLNLAGGIICPASPSFYSKPKTINELADSIVNRVITLLGMVNNGYKWGL